MSDFERLERRLTAVERALADSERPVSDIPKRAAVADDIDRLDERLDDLVARVANLEASTQALRGYVGNVRSVNEAVERRADAAVATVDRLERRIEAFEGAQTDSETTVFVSRAVVRDSTTSPEKSHAESSLELDPDTGPDSASEYRSLEESPLQSDRDSAADRLLLTSGGDRRSRPETSTTDARHGRRPGSSTIDHQQIEAQLAELTAADDESGRHGSADMTGETGNKPSTDTNESTTDAGRQTTADSPDEDGDSDRSSDTTFLEAVRGMFS